MYDAWFRTRCFLLSDSCTGLFTLPVHEPGRNHSCYRPAEGILGMHIDNPPPKEFIMRTLALIIAILGLLVFSGSAMAGGDSRNHDDHGKGQVSWNDRDHRDHDNDKGDSKHHGDRGDKSDKDDHAHDDWCKDKDDNEAPAPKPEPTPIPEPKPEPTPAPQPVPTPEPAPTPAPIVVTNTVIVTEVQQVPVPGPVQVVTVEKPVYVPSPPRIIRTSSTSVKVVRVPAKPIIKIKKVIVYRDRPQKKAVKPCYRVSTKTNFVLVGRNTAVTFLVTSGDRIKAHAKILIKGAGLNKVGYTDADGQALVGLKPTRAGIITVTVANGGCGSDRIGTNVPEVQPTPTG